MDWEANSHKYFLNEYGQYSRKIRAWKEEEKCLKCQKTAQCLATDSSDDEYSTIFLCFSCVNQLEKQTDKD